MISNGYLQSYHAYICLTKNSYLTKAKQVFSQISSDRDMSIISLMTLRGSNKNKKIKNSSSHYISLIQCIYFFLLLEIKKKTTTQIWLKDQDEDPKYVVKIIVDGPKQRSINSFR